MCFNVESWKVVAFLELFFFLVATRVVCYAGLASHVANPRIGRDGDDPSGRTVTWSAVQFD